MSQEPIFQYLGSFVLTNKVNSLRFPWIGLNKTLNFVLMDIPLGLTHRSLEPILVLRLQDAPNGCP